MMEGADPEKTIIKCDLPVCRIAGGGCLYTAPADWLTSVRVAADPKNQAALGTNSQQFYFLMTLLWECVHGVHIVPNALCTTFTCTSEEFDLLDC